MAFISTIGVDEAQGAIRQIYEELQTHQGYVPNYAKAFSHRPTVYLAWENLIASVRGNLDLRRYELVTIAAARGLRSSYCLLAHSNVLLKNGFEAEQVEAIARDYTEAELSPQEVAIMQFAEKIAREASSVSQEDVEVLRKHGLCDVEIFDVAAAASARCFFSKMLDALGTQADSIFMNMDESLRACLVLGREVSSEELEEIKS